jgi:hypothetical protein
MEEAEKWCRLAKEKADCPGFVDDHLEVLQQRKQQGEIEGSGKGNKSTETVPLKNSLQARQARQVRQYFNGSEYEPGFLNSSWDWSDLPTSIPAEYDLQAQDKNKRKKFLTLRPLDKVQMLAEGGQFCLGSIADRNQKVRVGYFPIECLSSCKVQVVKIPYSPGKASAFAFKGIMGLQCGDRVLVYANRVAYQTETSKTDRSWSLVRCERTRQVGLVPSRCIEDPSFKQRERHRTQLLRDFPRDGMFEVLHMSPSKLPMSVPTLFNYKHTDGREWCWVVVPDSATGDNDCRNSKSGFVPFSCTGMVRNEKRTATRRHRPSNDVQHCMLTVKEGDSIRMTGASMTSGHVPVEYFYHGYNMNTQTHGALPKFCLDNPKGSGEEERSVTAIHKYVADAWMSNVVAINPRDDIVILDPNLSRVILDPKLSDVKEVKTHGVYVQVYNKNSGGCGECPVSCLIDWDTETAQQTCKGSDSHIHVEKHDEIAVFEKEDAGLWFGHNVTRGTVGWFNSRLCSMHNSRLCSMHKRKRNDN